MSFIFSFITLHIPSCFLLAHQKSAKKTTASFMGVSFMSCFSLAGSKFFDCMYLSCLFWVKLTRGPVNLLYLDVLISPSFLKYIAIISLYNLSVLVFSLLLWCSHDLNDYLLDGIP